MTIKNNASSVSSRKPPIGLYLHIPFCRSKCPYCDFFSRRGNDEQYDEYTILLCRSIETYGRRLARTADTVYFGGGTPGILGAQRLCRILSQAVQSFSVKDAEITLELNPEKKDTDFEALRKGGFNRVSIGLQSSDDNELRLLGRLHDSKAAEACIRKAQSAGFDNISLDLMIATPAQTTDSLKRSIDFCAEHGAAHISAYILKIEPGTVYYKKKDSLLLPDEDEQADMYLFAVETLKEYGYAQYEISNFARPGYESRHNLKYWHDEEYLGLGPSAHSFIDGKRRCFDRSFESFAQDRYTDDGEGGSIEEYIMLGLRLNEGISYERFAQRFGMSIPDEYISRAGRFAGMGYTEVSSEAIKLTEKGFLLSNAIIGEILA